MLDLFEIELFDDLTVCKQSLMFSWIVNDA